MALDLPSSDGDRKQGLINQILEAIARGLLHGYSQEDLEQMSEEALQALLDEVTVGV